MVARDTFPTGPGPEPAVVRVVRTSKDAILAMEADQMRSMAARWLQVERAIEAQISSLAEEIALAQLQGETVSLWKVMEMDRYRALLAQASVEVNKYNRWAAVQIEGGQITWGELGAKTAQEALMSAYLDQGKVGAFFDVLPKEAVYTMAGLAGDGSPLALLLKQTYPDAVDGLTNALIDAIARGVNPRETARAMRDGFGMGLNRALVISRTEQLRTYRTASRLNYERSGLVVSYKRIATRDTRVCLGCMLMDGKEFDLAHDFEEHPQGRCTMVPVVKGLRAPSWTYGVDWFQTLPGSDQRAIMGPKKYDAWVNGAFDLGDAVSRREDDTWGGSFVPKPFGELVPGA